MIPEPSFVQWNENAAQFVVNEALKVILLNTKPQEKLNENEEEELTSLQRCLVAFTEQLNTFCDNNNKITYEYITENAENAKKIIYDSSMHLIFHFTSNLQNENSCKDKEETLEDLEYLEKGYIIKIEETKLKVESFSPRGLFYALQTLRQLLPPELETTTHIYNTNEHHLHDLLQTNNEDEDREEKQKKIGIMRIQSGMIKDKWRYEWRGMMLDVARHFFNVQQVMKIIEVISRYKLNILHLHLSDDQGWRIMINTWKNLALHGGRSAVGGGPGGYYSQEEYKEIVAYAKDRFITIVPEIDMPGHTNAALSSYACLNPNNLSPEPYHGIDVGFSSLDIKSEVTNQFVDDVIREIAAITPGAFIHIGGDESQVTGHDDYVQFIEYVQRTIHKYGKRMIGWEEINKAKLEESSIVQFWKDASHLDNLPSMNKIIMSPASKTYLDMKYDEHTPLGLKWAGYISLHTSYNWDPSTFLLGKKESDNNDDDDVDDAQIIGIEAPLWSETIVSLSDLEQLCFPRLLSYAEIGWSSFTHPNRDWDYFLLRLSSQLKRLSFMNVKYYSL